MTNQPISSIMSSDLILVSPSDKLGDAFHLMRDNHIHHLVVLQDGKLAGVLSANDVLDTSTEDKNWSSKPVASVMTTKLAKINQNDPIATAAQLFNDYWFHALPVLDNEDNVVGIVTLLDVTRYMTPLLFSD